MPVIEGYGMGLFNIGKQTADGDRIEAFIKELTSKQINVGFNEKSGSYEDGTTTAQVAAWNEYGTEHSPARPFMRQTIEKNEKQITSFINAKAGAAIKSGGSAAEVLNAIGAYTKGRMQKEIRDGDFTPNAPSTIARKGSSKPLIDTTHMRQNIVYVIKEKGT